LENFMKVDTSSHLLLTRLVSIFEHSDLHFTKKAAKTKKEYFFIFQTEQTRARTDK